MKYLSIIFLLFMSCSLEKKTNSKQTGQGPGFDLQGHRGCRGLMPENTIRAMINAIELGVTTLEMDVVITKDSQVILSHDPYFNHEITTKPDGSSVSEKEEKQLNIFKMSYQEVTQFDVGMKPNPRFPEQQKFKAVKPLLSEVIDSVENYISINHLKSVYYNIETKCTPYTDGLFHPAPNQFVELLLQEIIGKKIEKRVVIQSFDIRSLQYLHERYPAIKTSLLIEDNDKRGLDEHLRVLGFNPTIYSPHVSLVHKELIKECHAKGVQVIPWTVNSLTEMKQLKSLEVDGLISDYPNLYKDL